MVREIFEAARAAGSNDNFFFALRVRAPAYPPADFFHLVTSAPLWYLGKSGKLIEAARAAHARMMISFLRCVCARSCIH